MQAFDGVMIGVRILVAVLGVVIVLGTVISAVNTFIVPRGINVWLTRAVFGTVRFFFNIRARKANSYEAQDRIMALYAPLTLFILPIVLLSAILLGYMCIYWALETRPIATLFTLSGSSLLTLGYASVDTVIYKILEFSEATIGLILIALLIAYLPTMYSAFSQREAEVAMLEARAGTPPTFVGMIGRSHRIGELDSLVEVWISWQEWFANIEESHTSLAPLSFFRSPRPERSWITAAGTVLDGAAIVLSTVDVKWEPRAALCIRAGYLALRSIADFFGVSYDANPAPDAPISISRSEFDQVYEELAAQDVPLKPDRDQAWQDYTGWRVNYDTVLLQLAALTMAPYGMWSSDRSAVAPRTMR